MDKKSVLPASPPHSTPVLSSDPSSAGPVWVGHQMAPTTFLEWICICQRSSFPPPVRCGSAGSLKEKKKDNFSTWQKKKHKCSFRFLLGSFWWYAGTGFMQHPPPMCVLILFCAWDTHGLGTTKVSNGQFLNDAEKYTFQTRHSQLAWTSADRPSPLCCVHAWIVPELEKPQPTGVHTPLLTLYQIEGEWILFITNLHGELFQSRQ